MPRQYIPGLRLLGAGILALGLLMVALSGRAGTKNISKVPAYTGSTPSTANQPAQAVLAGGCFWGMEMVFQHIKGVKNVVSGYAGGSKSTANYADSSTGNTRQAESVHIFYDPNKIDYASLLRVYFSAAHDPTQVDRQGPDVGHEYRSVIFALNSAQKQIAQRYIRQLGNGRVFSKPIATTVDSIQPDQFYPAASYHQNYAIKHPRSTYIRIYDQPKVAALKREFPNQYSRQPRTRDDVG